MLKGEDLKAMLKELNKLKDTAKVLLEDDEFFEIQAKALRKFHEALIKAGFTSEQAVTITAGKGIGITNTSQYPM